MKIIAVSAVTAGGKTTLVNALKEALPKTAALYFDDYTFAGEVEDYSKWLSEGADVHVWDLSPLKADMERIIRSGEYDYLLLDYPFAYEHQMIKDYLDCCIFIDTPLDVALARWILRDMKDAAADAIRNELAGYLKYARPAFVQMRETQLLETDHVLDGTQPLETMVHEALQIIADC